MVMNSPHTHVIIEGHVTYVIMYPTSLYLLHNKQLELGSINAVEWIAGE